MPLLAKTILTSGPKVLAKLSQLGTSTAGASIKFVKTAMLKVVLEIEIANFTKNTVKDIIFGVEALKGTGISFSTAAASRLEKEGVTFIKAINKDGKVGNIAAIYKGEAIASGTAKEVRETLKDLWTARGVKLTEALEELYKLIPKIEGRFWTWENFMGTKLSKPYLSEKALLNKINEIKTNNQLGVKGSISEKLFEAEVGEEMFKLGKKYNDKAIDFANKVNKNNVGEIDYSSYKYIVEAKTNLDSYKNLKDLQKQLERYLHRFAKIESNYLNAQNKTVVVVYETGKIDKVRKESIEIIKQLKNDRVIFVDGIENLKKLY